MKTIVVLIVLVLGFVWCQDVNQLEDQFNNIKDSGQFNKSAEDVDKALREKCEKNGGPGAYDAIKDSKTEVQECFEKQINATVLMEELEVAKETGSMDEVFAKYCEKTPYFINCTKTVTDKVTLCLNPEEKDNMKVVLNVTQNLGKFICDKNGDRLAMFVAEGGKECLEEKKEDLQLCVNQTFSTRVPTEITMETLPLLLFDEQQCEDFTKLQDCVVSKLEKCKDKTPANIVEALFKFIYKSIPCKSAQIRTNNVLFKRDTSNNNNTSNETNVTPPPFNEHQYVDQVIRSIFYIKCKKYADENKYFAVEKTINDLQVVMRNVYRDGITCTQYKNELIDSMKKVTTGITACLPPTERYMSNFITRGTNAVLNYLCPTDSMQRLLTLFQPQAMQCLHSGNQEGLNKCLYLSQTEKQVHDNELIVSRTELCMDLSKMKKCIVNYVSLQCPEYGDFQKVVTYTLNAALEGCRANSNASGQKKSFAVQHYPYMSLIIFGLTYVLYV